MRNLTKTGDCLDDQGFDYDFARHAPSEFIEASHDEREERKRRDREELVDLWHEETRTRRRERVRGRL